MTARRPPAQAGDARAARARTPRATTPRAGTPCAIIHRPTADRALIKNLSHAVAAIRDALARPLLSSDPHWVVALDRHGAAIALRRRRFGGWRSAPRPSRSPHTVALLAPADMLSRSAFVPPICSDAKLRRAIALSLPTFTPIPRRNAAIAVTRRSRQIADLAIADRRALARLTAVDAPWRAELGFHDAAVAGILADLDAADPIAPLDAPPSPRRRPAIWVAIAAGAIAAGGIGGLLAAPVLSALEDRAALRAEIAALSPAAAEARKLTAERGRLIHAHAPFVTEDGPQSRSMLAAMAKIAAALPEDAILDQILLDADGARVVGIAASAAEVLDRLAAAPGFDEIEAHAPSTALRADRERFDIALVAGPGLSHFSPAAEAARADVEAP